MLCINSSQIAGLTGNNKYVNYEKFIKIFIENLYKKRNDLKEIDEGNGSIEFISDEEYTKQLLFNLDINEIIEINNIINSEIKDNNSLHLNSEKLQNVINKSNISTEKKDKIKREINEKINCNYGNNTENKSINILEKTQNIKVYDNNLKCYIKYYDNFLICGKIDGLINKNGKIYINEMKNRKNRIFDFIPLYEKIQLLSYTKLLENTNIIFTQSKDDEQKTEIFENYKDDELWDLVLSRLKIYSNIIYKLRDCNDLRSKFLKKTEKLQYTFLKEYLDWL
jgi:hypothetical protein